jgi:hypothetical protein
LGNKSFRRNQNPIDNISSLADLEKIELIAKFEKMTMNLEGYLREFLRWGKSVPKYGA